ncbi:hypothetical protein GDO78_014520 [Eleutherodactylus coqui]|uniref:Core Histone H2A/H2B/H3 domain-containing protein n=1 Tax=Eleutherodactylus coqui TaxID=57060 RepID=A0A8J6B1D0_ELECQ|nr:hypothetical protein GDO78_014520 [Eleutherodactylus coqui]
MRRSNRRKSSRPQRIPAASLQSLPQSPPRRWETKHSEGKPRRRRCRPGAQALIEIRKYQKSTELLIQETPFARLVRGLHGFYRGVPFLWQSMAIMALQEGAEAFLVRLFGDAQHCCGRAKRVTLFAKDIRLAQGIRGMREGLG